MKNTDKIQLVAFVNLCAAYGLRKIVISPGSRNAPLIMAFHNHPKIECYVIPDERSASYFALGIAQYCQQPVGILCTSGTAALNYTAAMAEAYCQKLPLVAITADRPAEWVDQADGQTINQKGIYANFTVYEAVLPVEIKSEHDSWYLERMVRDGFSQLRSNNQPIHFNVPLREPLYNIVENYTTSAIASSIEPNNTQAIIPTHIAANISNFRKILIVMGMQHPCNEFLELIQQLAMQKNVVIFAETLSNIASEYVFQTSDALISALRDKENEDLIPDLVISFGHMLLSKQLKEWLRSAKSTNHWVVNASATVPDVFKRIDKHIVVKPIDFIRFLTEKTSNNTNYYNVWQKSYTELNKHHSEYLEQSVWSDLKVFQALSKSVPSNSIIQLANSSVVRYAQFFEWNNEISFYGNRGTSGIDGSSSTAVGMASQTSKTVTLISGDISFLYDSNALWNTYKGKNLKIIVINNKGGNIFGLIPGPDNTGLLNEYFTTHIPVSIEHICKAYSLGYIKANNEKELSQSVELLYKLDNCCLLEIDTDLEINIQHWKSYFKTIKNKYCHD